MFCCCSEHHRNEKKLLIIGDDKCGKSCLSMVFAKNIFPLLIPVPNVFANYYTKIEVDGKEVVLDLWDSFNDEEYKKWIHILYREIDVLLLCFSVDSPDSLKNILDKWMLEVKHFCPRIPIILIATKKDLRNDPEELNKMREGVLTPEDGRTMAEKINAFAYLECSAKNKEGVQEVFEAAARAALKKKQKWLF